MNNRNGIYGLVCLVALTLLTTTATAETNDLEQFLFSLKTLDVRYAQTEVERNSFTAKTTYGRFILKVPNQFVWQDDDESQQKIVADGDNLWVYEKSLQQASRYQAQEILINTPALLISVPNKLNANFIIDQQRKEEQGTWYSLSPKQKNTLYDYIEVTIEKKKLVKMVIGNRVNDSYTRIEFYYSARSLNYPIDEQTFVFNPPPNTDILSE